MPISASTRLQTIKPRPVFYTPNSAPVRVALWKNEVVTPRAPALTGFIGDKKVSCFVREGTSKFLGLSGNKMPNGYFENLGTANVVTGARGYPKLVINLSDGNVIWADTSKEGTNEFLEALGLNIETMLSKQKQYKENP